MSDSRLARSAGFARSFPVLALVALATLGSACNARPGSGPAPSADAWAVVDGREIKRDDVEKAYRRAMQAQAPTSEEEALTAKLNLLNEMIVQDILIAKAGALKIEVPEAELNSAYEAGKKDVPPAQFTQELARRQITEADMKEGLRRELLVQKLLDKEVTAKATVTDQEIADFYNANKAQFNFPEEAYHLAQIVVTPVRDQEVNNRSGDDATTPEQAIQKANMLMERLKGGAQFADLARDFSEDSQSAPRGGDLGFIPVSALNQAPPPLRDSVLKASPGTVSAVSINGAHSIVLLVAKEAAGQRDLTAPNVRDGISNTLKGRKEALVRTAYLTTARSDATVVNVIAKKVLESPGQLPTVLPKAPGTP